MQKNNTPTSNTLGLITVLAARFSAIGDVAMTVPVLYSVARCYPDVRFVFVTRPSMTSDRKSTRLNSSHMSEVRIPSFA